MKRSAQMAIKLYEFCSAVGMAEAYHAVGKLCQCIASDQIRKSTHLGFLPPPSLQSWNRKAGASVVLTHFCVLGLYWVYTGVPTPAPGPSIADRDGVHVDQDYTAALEWFKKGYVQTPPNPFLFTSTPSPFPSLSLV